jgi:hypothetical protein
MQTDAKIPDEGETVGFLADSQLVWANFLHTTEKLAQ